VLYNYWDIIPLGFIMNYHHRAFSEEEKREKIYQAQVESTVSYERMMQRTATETESTLSINYEVRGPSDSLCSVDANI